MTATQARIALIEAARSMAGLGINQGTAGNISVRTAAGMLITPSAIPYDNISPEMVALMPLEGAYGAFEGPKRPSSEWRFHLDIMLARPEVGAIVHTHAPYATAISMTRRGIPPCAFWHRRIIRECPGRAGRPARLPSRESRFYRHRRGFAGGDGRGGGT
jgi:L-fuculose-phosphate aldolase